jgi:GH18 family chitinase
MSSFIFMAYILDINGNWNTVTGPNAPFNYAPGQDPYSFVQAITDWKAANVPANQLVAGMAYYGRSTTGKYSQSNTIDPYMYSDKLM